MRGGHDNDEGKDIINEGVEGLQSVSTELNVALPVSSTLQQLVASYKTSNLVPRLTHEPGNEANKASYPGRLWDL